MGSQTSRPVEEEEGMLVVEEDVEDSSLGESSQDESSHDEEEQEQAEQQEQQQAGEQQPSSGPISLIASWNQARELARDPIEFLRQRHEPMVNHAFGPPNQGQVLCRRGPYRSGSQSLAYPHSVPRGVRSGIMSLHRAPSPAITPRVPRPNGRIQIFEIRRGQQGEPPNGQRQQQQPNGQQQQPNGQQQQEPPNGQQQQQEPPNGQLQEELLENLELMLLANWPGGESQAMYAVHLRFDDF